MCIIPVSQLSSEDLAFLGNNLVKRPRPGQRRRLAAVNRSLAIHGEQVSRLHRPGMLIMPAGWHTTAGNRQSAA